MNAAAVGRGAIAMLLAALWLTPPAALARTPHRPARRRPPRESSAVRHVRTGLDAADLLGKWVEVRDNTRPAPERAAGIATSTAYEFLPDGSYQSRHITLSLSALADTQTVVWRGHWSLLGYTLTLRGVHKEVSRAVDQPPAPAPAAPMVVRRRVTGTVASATGDGVTPTLLLDGVRYRNEELTRFAAMPAARRRALLAHAARAAEGGRPQGEENGLRQRMAARAALLTLLKESEPAAP